MKTPNGDLDRWPDPASSNARRSVFAQDLVMPEITVAGSGRVEGPGVAHDLVVLGAVSGTISARYVQLAPSAVVQADIIHERIAIEAGAKLEGKLQRKA